MTKPSARPSGSSRPTPAKLRSLPRGVWGLGLTSLFMDSSSELIHSVLPVFMASVLGAGMVTIGLVEGVAEATAAVAKVFSGALSDRAKKRKTIIVAGYGLAALSKLLFPLAQTITWVMSGRFVDRLGKGIRGAPRDALVADLTPVAQRGAAYGLRQSLDSVGAFLGPLLAIVLLAGLDVSMRSLLWLAAIPAFIAVVVLVAAVKEPERPSKAIGRPAILTRADLRKLPNRFWFVAGIGVVFSLARFSEAFLLLRGSSLGLAAGWVPAVMIAMNLVYSATAWPMGIAADRMSARRLLLASLVPLLAADALLAVANSTAMVFAGAALWGLHMGMSQGLLAKLVADAAPESLRGTSFGLFNLVSGVALFASSLIAGSLWQAFGAPATFSAGAAFALIAGLGLLAAPRESKPA